MESLFFDLGVSAVLTALKAAVKNPKHKENLKAVMRKIYVSIGAVYPEFQDGE